MINKRKDLEHGGISGPVIAVILLSITVVIVLGLSIWLYMQYSDQKTRADKEIDTAVGIAVKDARDEEAIKYRNTLNNTLETFKGPSDYGSLTFTYPKFWSVYVDEDASTDGNYAAYLNPRVVPPVDGENQRFGMRVLIEDTAYDEVATSYDDLVEEGMLKSSTVEAKNGERGTRFDGTFDENIRGSVVIFKVRDKTISLFTDANTFKSVYEKSIKTIDFSV